MWFRPLEHLREVRGRHATTLRIRDNLCLKFGGTILAVMCFVAAVYSQRQAPKGAAPNKSAREEQEYDGNWWASADRDRREGFFWGAGDCLGWEANIGPDFFSGATRYINSDSFDKEVSGYYERHPSERGLRVIEVWRKVAVQMGRDTPQTKGGEVYTNPHGFLDGLWFRGVSQSERLGFLQGYLECLKGYVSKPKARYSRSVE